METNNSLVILLDFDGTCVSHDFPYIGKDIGAVSVLKEIVANGHRLILFTMRSNITAPKSDDANIVSIEGEYLTEALNWFKTHGIPLYGIQTNPTQHTWTSSPKAYGQLIIDDICLGVPLVFEDNHKPYVDWLKVRNMLIEKQVITILKKEHYEQRTN